MCDTVHASEKPGDERLFTWRRNVKWCALWDYRGAEVLNAMLTFLFGFWLLVPAWRAFSQCPQVYIVMEAMGELVSPSNPELPWGVAFVFVSFLKALVLWRDHARGRKWTALMSGTLWVNVTATVAYTNIQVPMFPIYVLLALNMYRVFFCIRVPESSA